jgi:hypothetical protein
MPSSGNRRRVEIPAGLYREIEQDALRLRVPMSSYVTLLLSGATGTAHQTGVIPFRLRDQPPDDQRLVAPAGLVGPGGE